MPSAAGKLRRGELGRGRNRAPGYKVTRENQSPLEWSWHRRHRNQQTVDQWAPLGGGSRRGPGQDIAPRKVCHALSKPPPKVAGDPVTCSDVWVRTLSPVSAECQCHTHRMEPRKTLSWPNPTPDSHKTLFPAYKNIFPSPEATC